MSLLGWLSFLFLGVEPVDSGVDPAAPSAPEPVSADPEPGAEPAPEPAAEPAPRVDPQEDRIARLERELAEERAARRAAPAPTADPDFEREEATLREAERGGADQNTLYWMRFKIDSDRKLRTMERQNRATQASAADAIDKADFARVEAQRPDLFKRYGDRVEQMVSALRAQGQNVTRMMALQFLIGNDVVMGQKGKTDSKAPAAPAAPRAKPPSVRSDVPASGRGKTEREKRIERLNGVQI